MVGVLENNKLIDNSLYTSTLYYILHKYIFALASLTYSSFRWSSHTIRKCLSDRILSYATYTVVAVPKLCKHTVGVPFSQAKRCSEIVPISTSFAFGLASLTGSAFHPSSGLSSASSLRSDMVRLRSASVAHTSHRSRMSSSTYPRQAWYFALRLLCSRAVATLLYSPTVVPIACPVRIEMCMCIYVIVCISNTSIRCNRQKYQVRYNVLAISKLAYLAHDLDKFIKRIYSTTKKYERNRK